jgi:hypothetical protein
VNWWGPRRRRWPEETLVSTGAWQLRQTADGRESACTANLMHCNNSCRLQTAACLGLAMNRLEHKLQAYG